MLGHLLTALRLNRVQIYLSHYVISFILSQITVTATGHQLGELLHMLFLLLQFVFELPKF